MAPQPKRKHSTRRKGKRLSARLKSLDNLVPCQNCGKKKLPHRVCRYCRK